jgi:hypothetical protein
VRQGDVGGALGDRLALLVGREIFGTPVIVQAMGVLVGQRLEPLELAAGFPLVRAAHDDGPIHRMVEPHGVLPDVILLEDQEVVVQAAQDHRRIELGALLAVQLRHLALGQRLAVGLLIREDLHRDVADWRLLLLVLLLGALGEYGRVDVQAPLSLVDKAAQLVPCVQSRDSSGVRTLAHDKSHVPAGIRVKATLDVQVALEVFLGGDGLDSRGEFGLDVLEALLLLLLGRWGEGSFLCHRGWGGGRSIVLLLC